MFPSAWAASESVQVAANAGVWHFLFSAGPIVLLTLLVLVAMSVLSWAIMVHKGKQFKAVEQGNIPFETDFWKASSLDEIYDKLNNYENSNLASVFRMGYIEMKEMADSSLLTSISPESEAPVLTGIDNLGRALRKAIDLEISRLESRLNFLASVGSVGPFVGLFGTVWGIMTSFQQIGYTGSASLAVVAPGISHALIATAVGLAAAIPSSIGYNMFVTRIKKQELDLNNFASDFMNLAKRKFFRGQ